MAAPAKKTVLETIPDWSLDRPMWQRDALRRIVLSGKVDANGIGELAALCKQGRGDATQTHVAPQSLSKVHLPANPGGGDAVKLLSLSEVEAANNLAPGQELKFEPGGITIVYGDNGSGKSGYARILKRACRARYAGKIEPNVYAPSTTLAKASASISYAIGATEKPAESGRTRATRTQSCRR
jgi:hypothetical protein